VLRTRIRELRARHHLTQEELARAVGVRRETIVHLERGRYNPSLLLAHRIAVALHSSIEEVFVLQEEAT
jgi:DNA-binding XRE family transcriptional regulator